MVDNAGGIRQAMLHLCSHVHKRIALIAGLQRARGDSAQRREAYSRALVQLGLSEDPALIAYGLHSFSGGQRAMREILAAQAPFDAVLASNDRSAMGAIEVLKAQGLGQGAHRPVPWQYAAHYLAIAVFYPAAFGDGILCAGAL